jgi:hypothetical protein
MPVLAFSHVKEEKKIKKYKYLRKLTGISVPIKKQKKYFKVHTTII